MFQAIFSSTWESIDQSFYTKLAQSIDPIDSTLTFFAEILATGILKSVDKDGNDVTEDDRLVALLKNPNTHQGFEEFIKEWLYYLYSHGWDYIVPQASATGFERRLDKDNVKIELFALDPDHINWIDQSYFFGLIKRNKEIRFNYRPFNLNSISFSDIIPFYDVRQNSEKPWIGVSRLLALRQQIQNYSLALQAKENMIKRSGSQLVALDGKTEDMGMDSLVGTGKFDSEDNPVTTTQKEKLETQIRETGIGNNSMGIIFANLPLKVQSLSAGLDKIKYDEIALQDARIIMNKFNMPKEFQNLVLNDVAKYDERNSGMKEIIQNIIEPLGYMFCEKFRTYFKWENNVSLSYSHLPVFSENESTKTETLQKIVDLYVGLYDKKAITLQELTTILKENGINISVKTGTVEGNGSE